MTPSVLADLAILRAHGVNARSIAFCRHCHVDKVPSYHELFTYQLSVVSANALLGDIPEFIVLFTDESFDFATKSCQGALPCQVHSRGLDRHNVRIGE